MFCPQCGNAIPDDVTSCPICHALLDTSSTIMEPPVTSVSVSSTPELISHPPSPSLFTAWRAMYQTSRRGFLALFMIILVLGVSTIGLGLIAYQSSDVALQNQLTQLQTQYDTLFANYQELDAIVNEPYGDLVTPTFQEVEDWLATDGTDAIPYEDGVWMCGDYAAMLMVKAKANGWRIRIAVIWYSLAGDPTYGVDTAWGTNGHAFNLINCTTGTLYIEPQTDAVFWYPNDPFHNMADDIWETLDFTHIDTGTLWDGEIIWLNSYGYLG